MTTKAKHTRQTQLQRGDGAVEETFTTIAEVRESAGPNEEVGDIEVTSFDSTAKEYIADLPDSGEVTFDMNFIGDDVGQQGLRADLRAGTARNFILNLNDNDTDETPTTVAFTAIVKKLEPKQPGGGAYSQSCTLRVTGQPVWTYRAPA